VIVLWHLGYPDQAEEQMNKTLALAHEIAHPYTLANVLGGSVLLYQHRHEVSLVQEQAERAISLCQQQGFRFWLAHCTTLEGWALAQQGQIASGIARMQEGLAARRAMDAHLNHPMFLALLAEVYGQAGEPEQGLRLLDEALAQVEATDERYFEAEQYRLKGELLRLQGADAQEVESHLLRALAVARQQEAKSLELRAAMSLARLWQQQAKCRPAYDLLVEVYSWFREGFDTPDLKEARALLEALS
jgi:predicted ATPase